MKNRSYTLARWLCVTGFACSLAAHAITPEDLRRQLDAGEAITLIDLRPAASFAAGHIPNAIHVPASLVPHKQLPPLGRVVAYDEGLGRDVVEQAVAALNAKTGITAEALDGGLAAWEQSVAVTTSGAGMEAEKLPFITYDHLKKTPTDDLVLVDLRRSQAAGRFAAQGGAAMGQSATDLEKEFPGAAITRSKDVRELKQAKAARKGFAQAAAPSGGQPTVGGATESAPLLVLIDEGDGQAQETARMLKANGVKRFVILAGGEEILERKGQRGLQRVGATMTIRHNSNTNLVNP